MIINTEAGSIRGLPKYTYTGTHELINDGHGAWRLKLKSSGTLTFTSRKGLTDGVDVFLVGGGGGASGTVVDGEGTVYGGASGFGGSCTTTDNVTATKETAYTITIGGGGTGGTVSGGSWYHGAAGTATSGLGSSANGGVGSAQGGTRPGATPEFGEAGGTEYSGVGAEANNSGHGGAARNTTGTGINGSSGIVIIRNHREVS